MLEVGKTFVKNGKTFCLIELLNYNSEKYAVFSVEDKGISFMIYKVEETANNYKLLLITDDELKFILFEMIEKEGE